VGSISGSSLTSRTFRDPDSLKEGLQRKFICGLNAREESVKPSYPKEICSLFYYSRPRACREVQCLLQPCPRPANISVTEQNGDGGPNHVARCSFWYCLLRPPLFVMTHCRSQSSCVSLPKRKGWLGKGFYSFARHREGLTGSTHFLQLFDARCMHYDLAGCTLTPGERFLLEDEKRGGKTCI